MDRIKIFGFLLSVAFIISSCADYSFINYYIELKDDLYLTVTYCSDHIHRLKYDGDRIIYTSTLTGWYVTHGKNENIKIPKDDFIRFHNDVGSEIFWNDFGDSIAILTSDIIIENKLTSGKIKVVIYNKDGLLEGLKKKYDNYHDLVFNKLKKGNNCWIKKNSMK